MNRRRFVISSAAVAATGAALASDGCSSSIGGVTSGSMPVPPQQRYRLTVGYTTSTFGAYKLRTRTYNGRTLGPTIVTAPGQTLYVEVVNKLPPNRPETVPSGSVRIPDVRSMSDMFARQPPHARISRAPIDRMNNPHEFNTTNLHVHGVQTIPHLFKPLGTSNPAAPMISIEPGESFLYPLPIPDDHPSGLFWYHPHHHGATDVQISGGMAGLLVVTGPIDQVPEIAAAREVRIAIQTLNVNPTPHKPNHFELEPTAYEPPPSGYNLGTDYSMLTVNGQGVNWMNLNKLTYDPLPVPQFTMAPGEVVRVRILNGTNFLLLPLVLPGMEVYAIATDGVNFREPRLLQQRGTTLLTPQNLSDESTIFLSPANRTEFLLRAPAKPGTYTLSATATKDLSFMDWPKFDLAQFVVSGAPVSMGIPSKLPLPTREYPIIGENEIVTRRTIAFSEGPNDTILTGVGFYINNVLYDEMTVSARPKVGTAEEWTLTNSSSEVHPLHLHDNSFQVIEIDGKPVDPVLICDTIYVPPAAKGGDGSVKFRVRFKEFTGKTVYHCHITPHEDTGMMQNILMV